MKNKPVKRAAPVTKASSAVQASRKKREMHAAVPLPGAADIRPPAPSTDRETSIEVEEHDLPEEMTAALSDVRPSADATGHQVSETLNEDEDDEGRSESEQLAEMGVGEAERDQILQAARALNITSADS